MPHNAGSSSVGLLFMLLVLGIVVGADNCVDSVDNCADSIGYTFIFVLIGLLVLSGLRDGGKEVLRGEDTPTAQGNAHVEEDAEIEDKLAWTKTVDMDSPAGIVYACVRGLLEWFRHLLGLSK
jgi:hypothetical protein